MPQEHCFSIDVNLTLACEEYTGSATAARKRKQCISILGQSKVKMHLWMNDTQDITHQLLP